MSYRGNKQRDFSVTSGRDGSRSFHSEHDNRWNNNNSGGRGRGGQQNRGSYRSRNTRGGTKFKHFNANSARYQRPRNTDEDGDISMSGDSTGRGGGYSSRSRGGRNNRRGGRYDRGGRQSKRYGGSNECKWFRVMVPFGSRMTKEDLYQLIRSNYEGDFKPVNYTAESESERVYFYVGKEDIETFKGLSRRITKPDGHKLVLHISPAPEYVHLDAADIEKLKIRMSDRYDSATQMLNLSALYNDEVLNRHNLYLALNRVSTMDAVTQIVAEYIPELTGLDVSNNRLLSLGHMQNLVKATPQLRWLNLSGNQIRSINELDKLKGWNVTELVLKGNELLNNFSNQNALVSAIRKHLPKVIKLDGQDLPPPITFDVDRDLKLPPSKDCHFINDDIKNLVVSFIKEFYTIYDSDKRRDLFPAYHENAQFTMCTSRNPIIENKQLAFNLYLDESRNLKKIGHLDPEKLVKKTKAGVLSVISMLEALPKTTHDLTSFKVDVNLATPTMLSFVVHGMFKENDSRSDKPCIRAFSRAFITIPSGAGMVITNDMLNLTNPSTELSNKAFKGGAPTPSSSPVNNPQGVPGADAVSPGTSGVTPAVPTYTQQQMQMVETFSQQSGMNQNFSLKCLEENGWDFQRAGEIFTNLNSQGKIPPEAFVIVKTEFGLQ